MRQSVRFGRVAGLPVGAHWSVVIILGIFADVLAASVLPANDPHQPAVAYWAVGFIAAACLLASLLAHELSHALVARRNGVGVRSITLWMLGGVAELEGEPPSPGADLRIALAGPAASLIAGAVFIGAAAAIGQAGGPALAVAAAAWLGVMNGLLAIFNLLPGAPLDGGRVLRAALWRRYGDRDRAATAAAAGGRYLGALLVGLGLVELVLLRSLLGGLWLMLIGWFLTSAAAAEQRAVTISCALRGLRVADVMSPHPEIAPGWASVAEFTARVAAARPPQRAFPVLSAGGSLAGVVVMAGLARIRPRERSLRRVEQVALAVPGAYRVAPEDPAAGLAARVPLGGEVAAIVLDEGRIVGMVTTADLRQALLRRRLAVGSGWPSGGADLRP